MRFRPTKTLRRLPRPQARPPLETTDALVALTYELLDAHGDTTLLAVDRADEAEWCRHIEYLRDLQRVGREVLAHAQSPL